MIFKNAPLGSYYERYFGVNMDANNPDGESTNGTIYFYIHSSSDTEIPVPVDGRTLQVQLRLNYFVLNQRFSYL